MPYYHRKDNGKIGLFSRKCSKCGKRWPISAWFQYPPSDDMTKFIIEPKRQGPAGYAKWADRLPGVNIIAKSLPNWPRWVRILITTLLVIGIACLFIFITRGF